MNGIVYDRALDVLAYTAEHATCLNELLIVYKNELENYIDFLKRSFVFLVRPHKELLTDDGIRDITSWEEVVRIDGMIKFYLEMNDIPYFEISEKSLSNRIKLITNILKRVDTSDEVIHIFFTGTHSSGKSTLAQIIAKQCGFEFKTGIARAVMKELNLSLSDIRSDIDAVNSFQTEILKRQITEGQ